MTYVSRIDRSPIYLIAAAFLMLGSCISLPDSTPVEKAPLEPGEQKELRETLEGTWRHTMDVEDDEEKLLDDPGDAWTLEEEGEGTFHYKVPVVGTQDSGDVRWKLNGRNLSIDVIGSEDNRTYRIDEWDEDKMTWFHYEQSETIVVESEDDFM